MTKYDLIIVLGSQPDTKTWKFPKQIYDCLDKAKELFDNGVAPFIATSGKWGISIDNQGLTQPFRECDALADYLIKKGLPDRKILREGDSKDTISNLYYLKTQLLIPRHLNNLLFVAAGFRIPRLKFLCSRVLGSEYTVAFEPIECEVGSIYNEPHTLEVQTEFLKPMQSGDHAWLEDKFYTAPMYHYWAKHDKALGKHH
ncbi:MAG TPA: YdcF family protein [Candidatus Saccharimonadales bacterium]